MAEILVDGEPKGLTPGRVDIDGGSGKHTILLRKAGFAPVEQTVSKKMDPWVWGNVPFVLIPIFGVAGVGIDACSGQWYRIQPNGLDVKLVALQMVDGTANPAPAKVEPDASPQSAQPSASVRVQQASPRGASPTEPSTPSVRVQQASPRSVPLTEPSAPPPLQESSTNAVQSDKTVDDLIKGILESK